jgi:hypothetical protein
LSSQGNAGSTENSFVKLAILKVAIMKAWIVDVEFHEECGFKIELCIKEE